MSNSIYHSKFNRRRLILNYGSNKQTKMKRKIERMKINEMQNLDIILNKSYLYNSYLCIGHYRDL